MRPLPLIFLSLAMIVIGYFAGASKIALPNTRPAHPTSAHPQELPPTEVIYEIDQIRSGRKTFDWQVISVVGGVCIGPDGEAYLIPDDDESLHEEPPGNGRYILQMADWRFRDLNRGVVYPRCVIKGRFAAIEDGIFFDALSPIWSVSWHGPIPKRKSDP